MSTISIKIEPAIGSDLADIARDACALATRLGVTVTADRADANGGLLIATPGDKPADVLALWQRTIR